MSSVSQNPLDSTPRRRCNCCENEFPLTAEFFVSGKRNKGGFRPICKVCHIEKNKEYNNRPEIKERRQAIRDDPETKVQKQAYDKDRYKQPEIRAQKLDYIKEYNAQPENRAHQQVYRRERNARPEIKVQKQAYDKERSSKPEVRVRRQGYLEEYRQRPETQVHLQKYFRVYYARPEGQARLRVYSHNRRARKKAVPGTLTTQQIQQKLRLQHYRCYYCSAKLERHKGKYVYHLEHTIPLARPEAGPRHDMSYTVLSCAHCNLSKHNKLPHEWPPGGRLL